MKLLKSKPGDERLIHDQTADWVDRSSALSRLVADGRRDLEPIARQWLQDSDIDLAREALGMLLSYWRRSHHAHEYVETAIRWLATAEDSDQRWDAASALGSYLYLPGDHPKDDVLRALLAALEHDEDESVQEQCYMALLHHVSPQEKIAFLERRRHNFDRATDVRWDLLAPLRERYGKS